MALRGISMLSLAAFLCLIYGLLYRLIQKQPESKLKQIAIISGAVIFVLQMSFVMLAKAGIRYDSLKVVDEAIALFSQQGIMATDLDGYFARYANNYAMTIMTHWFIKIFRMIGLIKKDFSNAVIVLQFINVLFVDAAFVGCYAFLDKYFGKAKAVLFLLYMAVNPLTYVWLPFYYTNTCSMAFAVWGIYLLYMVFDHLTVSHTDRKADDATVLGSKNGLSKQMVIDMLWLILAGVIFYLGYKIRATVIIALMAAMIGLFCTGKRISFKKLMIGMVCFGLSFLLTKAVYGVIEDHYLAFDETDTAFPLTHWVAMGLSEVGDGAYYANDEQRTMRFATAAEKKEATVDLMKERAKELGALGIAKLYMRKLSNTFADGAGGYHSELNISSDYGWIWQVVYGVHRDPVLVWTQFFYLMSIVCCIFVAIGLLLQKLPVEGYVLLLLLTGSYLFQMIWESATIYSIGTLYLNGCMVALGLSVVFGSIDYAVLKDKDIHDNREIVEEKNSVKYNHTNIFALRKIISGMVIVLGLFGMVVMGTKLIRTDYVEVSVSVDQFLFQAQEYAALSDGQCIYQTFESEKDFSVISFQVRNLVGEYNDSVYRVCLCDHNGDILQEQELIAANLSDYSFCPMAFHNQDGQKEYGIKIEKVSGEEDLIFLYYDTGHYDTYQNGKMTGPMVDGELADLLFEVYDREEE